jgi:hypothetical protein
VPTEKLVDGDFLARLVADSYETAIGAVDEAVMAHAGLFGGTPDSIRTIATYPDHVIVANPDGEFFRARWNIGEDSAVIIGEVEELDVPVYEADTMGTQVRQEAREATRLLLNGKPEEAAEKLRSLYRLVKSGVRLTAEGVEDLFNKQNWFEQDWFKAVEERGQDIRIFLGMDATRIEVPKPCFGELIKEGVSEDEAENHRGSVVAALRRLRNTFMKMRTDTVLAREVTEQHQLRGGGNAMSAFDFIEFVFGFSQDLDEVIGVLDDAMAVSEDGCVKCLARVHDGIADQAFEWGLAAAFSEKLARRFEPVAA